ncbi:MAG: tetratricopeptide repeat protein [Planctomycetes bacterium]|nr:tetratricopeptide repeat protein [Planctomycetota bacterium]
MTDPKRDSLIRALDLAILCLVIFSVSLRPLVCGEGVRLTFLGMVEAPVANLLVSLPFLFAFFLWLARMALKAELRLTRTGIGIPILLFVIFVVRSMFISHYEWRSAMTAMDWIGQVLLFYLLVNVLDDRRKTGLVVACLVATITVVAIQGLHQRMIGFPETLRAYHDDPAGTMRSAGVAPENEADFRSRLETFRVYGTFLLPTLFAGFLALVIPPLIGLFIDRMKRGNRTIPIALGAVIVLQLIALFLTKSKGGWITLAMGLFLFTALWGRRFVWTHPKWVAVGVALFIVVFGAAQWMGKLPPAWRYLDSLTVRAQYWRAGIEMIEDHPVSGIGLNEFGDLYTAYKRPADDETQMAHNNYIQLWAETGIFGLLAFCAVWGIFLARHFPRGGAGGGVKSLDVAGGRTDMELTMIGLIAGIVSVALAAGRFFSLPMGLGGILVALLGWVAAFLLVFAGANTFGAMTCRGIWIGVVCFLIHSLVDFDLYEPGVAQTLWTLAAIAVATAPGRKQLVRPLGQPGQVALAVGALVSAIAVVACLWPPVLLSGVHFANGRALLEDVPPKPGKAVAQLRKAAKLCPGNAAPQEWLAIIFRDIWKNGVLTFDGESTLSQAIEHYKRAIEINPRKAAYHFELAELYRESATNRAEQELAVKEYETAINHFPVKPIYLARLGSLYELLKRPRAVIEDTYRRALDMDRRAGRRYNKLPDRMRRKIEGWLGEENDE